MKGMSTNATASPRTAPGAATRARIVNAATDLVRAHGAANTTIDAVIEASKVSKSQIYHYFADKDDLVLDVIQQQAERVLGAHAKAQFACWTSPLARRYRRADTSNQFAGGCPPNSLAAA
jgi:TetR/AcrR family transcriptional repressor of nem operon